MPSPECGELPATAPAPEQQAVLLMHQSLLSSIRQPGSARTQKRSRPSKATDSSRDHPAAAIISGTGWYGREAHGTPDSAGSTQSEAWNASAPCHEQDGAHAAGNIWSGSWNANSDIHLHVSSGPLCTCLLHMSDTLLTCACAMHA